MLIDPTQFEQCFRTGLGNGWEPLRSAMWPSMERRYAIPLTETGQSPLHLVSAWASEQRVVLGQVAVDRKSNEITAIPALLAGLAIAGGLVTIDAVGCQKSIAQAILDQHADYVLTVKGISNAPCKRWKPGLRSMPLPYQLL